MSGLIFSDLCEFLPKSQRKAGDAVKDGQYPFFVSSNKNVKSTDNPDYNCEALVFGTGGSASIHHINGPFSTSGDCVIATAKSNSFPLKTLYYYLKTNIHILERGFKGAGLKHISKSFISEIQLPKFKALPLHKITNILDKADIIRKKRAEAITHLDEFLRATFLDMFGDLYVNPNSYPMIPLGKISQKFSDGPFGSNLKSSHYKNEGIRVIRLKNIGVDEFIDTDKAFVSLDHFQLIYKHECLPGDIIVGTLGEPNLRACILDHSIEKGINKADCVQIRVDPEKSTKEYICSLINQPATLALAAHLLHGQTRTRISMGTLRSLKVPIPEMDIQKKWSKIYIKVHQEKLLLVKAFNEASELFASLSQRAFKGEL